MRSSWLFFIVSLLVGAVFFAFARWLANDYLFFAGYTVLQFIVLATAWNILGGYCGYVNFGSAAFFAIGAYSSVALHKLGLGVERLLSRSAPGHCGFDPAAADSDPDRVRRHRLGPDRARHWLSDAAAAGGVLRHRHSGARGRAADAHRQLGLRRRLARRLYHPAHRSADRRQLYSVPLPDHAHAVGHRNHHGAHHRALAARLRLCHHPRRRARGGSLRRADPAAQADRHHDFRRADGHGRRTVPLLHRLS